MEWRWGAGGERPPPHEEEPSAESEWRFSLPASWLAGAGGDDDGGVPGLGEDDAGDVVLDCDSPAEGAPLAEITGWLGASEFGVGGAILEGPT